MQPQRLSLSPSSLKVSGARMSRHSPTATNTHTRPITCCCCCWASNRPTFSGTPSTGVYTTGVGGRGESAGRGGLHGRI